MNTDTLAACAAILLLALPVYAPVAGAQSQAYKVIVLADTRALHKETLDKIKEFRKTGGIADAVKSRILPDFHTESGSGRVLHRRIGDKDVYMVMDISSGEKMHFRAAGKVECWVAMDGSANALPVVDSDGNGTTLRYSGSSDGPMLIVFSPGEPAFEKEDHTALTARLTRIDGEWDIDIIPTMDNKWGDFCLPASDGLIGVEARAMDWSDGTWTGGDIFGYGPYMLTCEVDSSADIGSVLYSGLDDLDWTPYVWSWQYGVPDSPRNQGWHELLIAYSNTRKTGYALEQMRGGGMDERYVITVPEINPGVSTMTVKAVPQAGCPGAAFFGSPVVFLSTAAYPTTTAPYHLRIAEHRVQDLLAPYS